MPHQVTLIEALKGMSLEDYENEASVPACCSEGCMVEMDGTCEHGFPSIMLEAGVI